MACAPLTLMVCAICGTGCSESRAALRVNADSNQSDYDHFSRRQTRDDERTGNVGA